MVRAPLDRPGRSVAACPGPTASGIASGSSGGTGLTGCGSLTKGGGLGTLLAGQLLPAGLLHGFADPAARTAGYRVWEEVLPAGLAFHVFAVPGELDGRPIMATPYQDVWAISAEPMPTSLARGGKRSRSWAVRFGLVGIAFFAVSALFLLPGG